MRTLVEALRAKGIAVYRTRAALHGDHSVGGYVRSFPLLPLAAWHFIGQVDHDDRGGSHVPELHAATRGVGLQTRCCGTANDRTQ